MHYFTQSFYQVLLLLSLYCLSVNAYALQQINNNIPGEQISVNISTKTLTRIAIRGDRINKIISDSARFTTETDPDSGALFIRAQDEQPFPLFLTTESGNTYHLLLTPSTVDADNIEIIPPILSQAKADTWTKRTPYQTTITQLMTGMVNHSPPMGYQRGPDAEIPAPIFGNSLKATPMAVYQGKYLQGTMYILSNTGKKTIILSYSLLTHSDVLAVAFVDERLRPKQTTIAYQIRLRDNRYAP